MFKFAASLQNLHDIKHFLFLKQNLLPNDKIAEIMPIMSFKSPHTSLVHSIMCLPENEWLEKQKSWRLFLRKVGSKQTKDVKMSH